MLTFPQFNDRVELVYASEARTLPKLECFRSSNASEARTLRRSNASSLCLFGDPATEYVSIPASNASDRSVLTLTENSIDPSSLDFMAQE